jgi:RNA recognition motif-containing protein
MTKIYVGNLPFTTGDEELRELFARFGAPSSARVVTDKMTGRSRGFGFVEFDDDEQAKAAINELNGRDFNGRALTVNEARPQTGDRGPRRPRLLSGTHPVHAGGDPPAPRRF